MLGRLVVAVIFGLLLVPSNVLESQRGASEQVMANGVCSETKIAAYDNEVDLFGNVPVFLNAIKAQSFIPTQTGDLTRVSIYLNNVGATLLILVAVYADDAGGVPGSLL